MCATICEGIWSESMSRFKNTRRNRTRTAAVGQQDPSGADVEQRARGNKTRQSAPEEQHHQSADEIVYPRQMLSSSCLGTGEIETDQRRRGPTALIEVGVLCDKEGQRRTHNKRESWDVDAKEPWECKKPVKTSLRSSFNSGDSSTTVVFARRELRAWDSVSPKPPDRGFAEVEEPIHLQVWKRPYGKTKIIAHGFVFSPELRIDSSVRLRREIRAVSGKGDKNGYKQRRQ
ncbi:hypothetical protein B0H14DRAFT_2610214 [Mycena olivaceomarginata]|nr:hypothetical protein B0H14DRAFT_2610214 [Mycena olivaceomarginata]